MDSAFVASVSLDAVEAPVTSSRLTIEVFRAALVAISMALLVVCSAWVVLVNTTLVSVSVAPSVVCTACVLEVSVNGVRVANGADQAVEVVTLSALLSIVDPTSADVVPEA
jgi:uncharacterized membrane protein